MSRSSLSTEPINQYEPADSKARSNDDRHPPKVVHLSTYDIAGGAARAAYRLHAGLRKAGVDFCRPCLFVKRGPQTVQ